jgi:cytochrome c oxidase subunit II
MSGLLLLTGGILVIAVFVLIYRILALVNIARGVNNTRAGGYSNKVNGLLFILFFVVGFALIAWYSGKASEFYLPTAASDHGLVTDELFWTTTAITFVVFFLTHIVLFVAPYFFRYKQDRKALWWPDNTKLEVAWTVIPAIVLAVLVLTGWLAWRDIMSPSPKDSVQVEIMGKQFNWHVRYPGKDGVLGKYNFRKVDATNSMGMDFNDKHNDDDFQPSEIHLPKGKPVLLKIRARDVLHSVYMPHFRVKMDAVPGMPTQFWFVPNKTTAEMRDELKKPEFNYEMACTEVCGSGHFAMKFRIVVDEPAEYEKWFASQEAWSSLNKEYVAQVKAEANKKNVAKK